MASKTTPSLNEAIKRRSKRSTAGINSRYTETPSPSSRKLKSTPLNSTAKNSNKKNTITSEKKSSSFSGDIDSHTSLLKEIKLLETRLENQISKTNLLEEELDKLKQENVSLKTELKLQLDNIKLTINNDNNKNNNNNKSDVLNSMSNSGSIKIQTTITAIFLIVLLLRLNKVQLKIFQIYILMLLGTLQQLIKVHLKLVGKKSLKMVALIQCIHRSNQIIQIQLVAMPLTHRNLLLNTKRITKESVICLLLVTVT